MIYENFKYEIKIVGNIYKNKDLLKENKKWKKKKY